MVDFSSRKIFWVWFFSLAGLLVPIPSYVHFLSWIEIVWRGSPPPEMVKKLTSRTRRIIAPPLPPLNSPPSPAACHRRPPSPLSCPPNYSVTTSHRHDHGRRWSRGGDIVVIVVVFVIRAHASEHTREGDHG